MELTDTLKEFMEEGGDWERKATSLAGVSIIRLPATENRPASLAIDVNPINESGLHMKKKGVMIMNAAELAAFRALFTSDKMDGLIKALETVLPECEIILRPTLTRPQLLRGHVVHLADHLVALSDARESRRERGLRDRQVRLR